MPSKSVSRITLVTARFNSLPEEYAASRLDLTGLGSVKSTNQEPDWNSILGSNLTAWTWRRGYLKGFRINPDVLSNPSYDTLQSWRFLTGSTDTLPTRWWEVWWCSSMTLLTLLSRMRPQMIHCKEMEKSHLAALLLPIFLQTEVWAQDRAQNILNYLLDKTD